MYVYRTCYNNIKSGLLKTVTWQWDKLEEIGQKDINKRKKITDLIHLINSIQDPIYQLILLIDRNEVFKWRRSCKTYTEYHNDGSKFDELWYHKRTVYT